MLGLVSLIAAVKKWKNTKLPISSDLSVYIVYGCRLKQNKMIKIDCDKQHFGKSKRWDFFVVCQLSFHNSFYFPRAEFWLLENILLRRNSLHSFWYEINYFEFSTRLNMAVSRSALKDSHITHVHSCSVPVNGKGFSCSIENLNKNFWCIRSPKKRICFSSTVTNPRLVLNLNSVT